MRTSNAVSFQIAVTAHVDEGEQYRLGEMTFSGNKAVTNTQLLRDLFPIKDEDVFSPTKFAKGLENVKKAYQTQGYANIKTLPNLNFDEDAKTASFEIDMYEGKQYSSPSVGGHRGETRCGHEFQPQAKHSEKRLAQQELNTCPGKLLSTDCLVMTQPPPADSQLYMRSAVSLSSHLASLFPCERTPTCAIYGIDQERSTHLFG